MNEAGGEGGHEEEGSDGNTGNNINENNNSNNSSRHDYEARPAATLVRGTAANIPQPVFELNGSALVQLALQTLARFNFRLVEKLLIATIADVDVTVRHSIFSFFHGNRGFNDFLVQADSLSAVFVALNDEM
ncbi:hypothetical protein QUC31_001283 [Theobroma cacao]